MLHNSECVRRPTAPPFPLSKARIQPPDDPGFPLHYQHRFLKRQVAVQHPVKISQILCRLCRSCADFTDSTPISQILLRFRRFSQNCFRGSWHCLTLRQFGRAVSMFEALHGCFEQLRMESAFDHPERPAYADHGRDRLRQINLRDPRAPGGFFQRRARMDLAA